MSIIWLRSSEIHRAGWDECIKHAFNGSVYGYSWYLDAVCWEWEALVVGDYEMVMPLPLQKIGGVRIVANPFLLPYVSIYSRVRPSLEKIHQFFDAIPYGQVKLSLLPFNGFPQYALTPRKLPQMVPFDLIMDYDSVDQRFTSLFDQERYAKWEPQLSIVRTQNLSDYLTFRSAVGQKHAMEEIYLKRLISYALRFKSVGIYVAHDGVNMPVAMMVIVKCDNRLVVVDTARQRNDCGSSGLFYILRHVVRVNAESNLVLNFPCRPFFLTEASKPFCLYGVQYKKGMMRFI